MKFFATLAVMAFASSASAATFKMTDLATGQILDAPEVSMQLRDDDLGFWIDVENLGPIALGARRDGWIDHLDCILDFVLLGPRFDLDAPMTLVWGGEWQRTLQLEPVTLYAGREVEIHIPAYKEPSQVPLPAAGFMLVLGVLALGRVRAR